MIKEIAEGWKNYMFRKADIEEVADIRREICMTNECKKYSDQGAYIHCKRCSCPIESKIRSLRSGCPLKLWGTIEDLDLVISDTLFGRSKFTLVNTYGEKKVYRHTKYGEITITFNTTTKTANIESIIFFNWNQIQSYFKNKTGKNLN